MRLGLIGLANSGKTAVFNALTNSHAAMDYYHQSESNIAVVEVIDERVKKLSEMYQPKKTSHATIEIIDFAWNEEEESKEHFDFNQIRLLDALAIVLRNFSNPVIDETLGQPNPLQELKNIETEMIVSDLLIAEKRFEKIVLNLKRGVKSPEALLEQKVLERVIEILQQGLPVKELNLSPLEEKAIRGFQLLTNKPVLLVLNSDESNFGKNAELLNKLAGEGYETEEIAGLYEMELLNLDMEDRAVFMKELGIVCNVRDRIIKAAYRILGYISFFTVGKQEVRAWTINSGMNAQEAAGKIHTDLEQGFIRAECFTYDDLITFGSEKNLKEKGKIRLEGKSYQVKDGDLLLIRYSK